MTFDLQHFITAVAAAAALAVASGASAAAVLEFIKQIVTAFGGKIPGNVAGILSGLLSAAATASGLISQGFPLWEAIPAALVALFMPQLAYNIAKTQHDKVNLPKITGEVLTGLSGGKIGGDR